MIPYENIRSGYYYAKHKKDFDRWTVVRVIEHSHLDYGCYWGLVVEIPRFIADLETFDFMAPFESFGDYWGDVHYVPDIKECTTCERCANEAYRAYKHYRCIHGDDLDPRNDGRPLKPEDREVVYLCWECDNECMNGGNIDEDASEVLQKREEREYEDDPINNDPPPGYYGVR